MEQSTHNALVLNISNVSGNTIKKEMAYNYERKTQNYYIKNNTIVELLQKKCSFVLAGVTADIFCKNRI